MVPSSVLISRVNGDQSLSEYSASYENALSNPTTEALEDVNITLVICGACSLILEKCF